MFWKSFLSARKRPMFFQKLSEFSEKYTVFLKNLTEFLGNPREFSGIKYGKNREKFCFCGREVGKSKRPQRTAVKAKRQPVQVAFFVAGNESKYRVKQYSRIVLPYYWNKFCAAFFLLYSSLTDSIFSF